METSVNAFGSACFLINDENEILLIERTDNNMWGIVSGSTELGETVEETAVREVTEETGLIIDQDNLEFVKIFSGEEYKYTYPNNDQCYFVTIVYICRQFAGTLVQETPETSSAVFYNLDNIPENMSENDKLITSYIRDYILKQELIK